MDTSPTSRPRWMSSARPMKPSTHLLEEVEGFIGRALLIHKGRLVGDVQMSELEETGEGLIDFVKRNYGYRAERIRKAISELSGDE